MHSHGAMVCDVRVNEVTGEAVQSTPALDISAGLLSTSDRRHDTAIAGDDLSDHVLARA